MFAVKSPSWSSNNSGSGPGGSAPVMKKVQSCHFHLVWRPVGTQRAAAASSSASSASSASSENNKKLSWGGKNDLTTIIIHSYCFLLFLGVCSQALFLFADVVDAEPSPGAADVLCVSAPCFASKKTISRWKHCHRHKQTSAFGFFLTRTLRTKMFWTCLL